MGGWGRGGAGAEASAEATEHFKASCKVITLNLGPNTIPAGLLPGLMVEMGLFKSAMMTKKKAVPCGCITMALRSFVLLMVRSRRQAGVRALRRGEGRSSDPGGGRITDRGMRRPIARDAARGGARGAAAYAARASGRRAARAGAGRSTARQRSARAPRAPRAANTNTLPPSPQGTCARTMPGAIMAAAGRGTGAGRSH